MTASPASAAPGAGAATVLRRTGAAAAPSIQAHVLAPPTAAVPIDRW